MNFLDYKDNIVCASKYFTVEEMNKIYELGIRNFGENYVQDLLCKKEAVNHKDIIWHLIGHLQTNKVKQVINEIDYLHSLDSIKLAKEIQKYRINPLNCFIQLNISHEESKSGLIVENLTDFMEEIKKYDKINIIGFMAMGVDNNLVATENVFKTLNDLKKQYGLEKTSMGMSHDFELALKYQSDYLRIGSLFKGVI
ncbi:YggS family pyridoxal phosphate-dependent enzyme [Acholeplasma hippikon]|uniref:Predicted enzyme with a TIM-barrel fold n=1 Tax=Acholeplasma hippikon TaxID=264636 RepID=A0A449BIV0_9MOLU|nr:YggS family pyridoxal phosphate-dependent enzyme [Acholeplasma hippikon]VEU82385.1 Predicted enzyme with a TIM-barrel fold [Acholeplasma hippikon]